MNTLPDRLRASNMSTAGVGHRAGLARTMEGLCVSNGTRDSQAYRKAEEE